MVRLQSASFTEVNNHSHSYNYQNSSNFVSLANAFTCKDIWNKVIGVRAGGGKRQLPPPKKKFGEDQIRANSLGRIGKTKFLSVIKTEKFLKIGNDEQERGY